MTPPTPQGSQDDTFTAAQLIAWAEQQREYASSVFVRPTASEAYEQALNHLIHYVKHPIREII